MLGAGCSISSGCLSADGLIDDFKKRIYCQQNQLRYEDTENFAEGMATKTINESVLNSTQESEYSYFFRTCFPSRQSRNDFIKSKFQDKNPSQGYLCFANYVLNYGVHDVLTTNFDRLTEKAVYQLNRNYDLVEASDSLCPISGGKLVVTSLHGDYNYDLVQNTSDELQSLTKNTRLVFQNLRCQKIIVIGYSGQDNSVMSALEDFLKENRGVQLFWVVYEKAKDISQRIANLLSLNPDSALVESRGFDDLFFKFYKTYGPSQEIIDGMVSFDENSTLKFSEPAKPCGEIETNAFPCLEGPFVRHVPRLAEFTDSLREIAVSYSDSTYGFFDESCGGSKSLLSDLDIPNDLKTALMAKLIALSLKEKGLCVYHGYTVYREDGPTPFKALKFSVVYLEGRASLVLEPSFTFGREPSDSEHLLINSQMARLFSKQHEEMLRELQHLFFGDRLLFRYHDFGIEFSANPLFLGKTDNDEKTTFSCVDEPMMAINNRQSRNQISLLYDNGPEKILCGPSEIKVGVLCPKENRKQLMPLLENLQNGQSDCVINPNDVIRRFPGFESLFKVKLTITGDKNYQPTIGELQSKTQGELIDFLIQWMRRIEDKVHPDIFLIYFPKELENFRTVNGVDFHDCLKFRCLSSFKTQLIDEVKIFKTGFEESKTLFNLSVALYTKAVGMPWRPAKYDPTKFYLGMAFGQSKNGINLSCSQLFDGAGRGMKLLVSSISNQSQKNPYLTKAEAYALGTKIREIYYKASLPFELGSIVIHRTVPFRREEIEGFKQAFSGLQSFSLLQIIEYSDVTGYSSYQGQIWGFPQRRGTVWKISNTEMILWTDGSVKEEDVLPHRIYRTSTRGVSTPIVIRKWYGNQSIEEIAADVVKLTKMDFNSAGSLYSRLPVTLKFAKKLASILKNEQFSLEDNLIDFKYIM